jgi:P27 family predicted phage terminase small subunit
MNKEAPAHLSTESKRIWKKIFSEYPFEDEAGCLILQTALEAKDRLEEARKIINKEGMQVVDRFGQLKPHPLLTAERDSRAQFLAGLKALNLDLEPLRDHPGRPGGK